MLPRIGNSDEQTRINRQPLPKNETDKKLLPETKKTVESGSAARIGDLRMQGQQQRDRLERLIPGTVAGISTLGAARLIHATNKADRAWTDAYQKGKQEFQTVQPEIKARAEQIANADNRKYFGMEDYRQAAAEYRNKTGYKGATDLIEVSRQADVQYRKTLADQGFKPSDVRGDSSLKAADFLLKRADDGRPFSILDDGAVKARVAQDLPPGNYMVRISKRVFMTDPDARLTGSEKAWVALPDEAAGAKLNARGIMKHVGFDDATVNSPGTKASDYVLLVTKRNGQADVEVPTWESRINEAKTHDDFNLFKTQPNVDEFYRDVQKYSELEIKSGQTTSRYKTDVNEFWAAASVEKGKGGELKPERFVRQKITAGEMTPYEGELFKARNQMQNVFGMNENFGGKGWAVSPEGQVTGRELVIKNGKVAEQPQHIFLELRDGDFPSVEKAAEAVRQGQKSPLEIVGKTKTIAENPLRLRGEMRSGAIAGGAFSAATSLPEVFDQARRGDYTGAAKTFAVNTGGGATLGALSSSGERIVGRGLENALSRSNLAEKGLERLYESGAARSFAGRLAGTEASNVSSQAFNSTLRTMAGRVGGAGVVGGLVSGGFSAYDQIGAYKRGEVSASQAIGTVTGETAVGVGAGMAGAAAGAAIGSIIPGAGTIVGGVIGFGVGMAAGYLADKGLRGLGVNTAIAKGVTATIDAGSRLAGTVHKQASQALQAGRQYVSQKVTQAKAVYRSASTAVKTARAYVGQKLDNARQRVSGATRAAVNYVSQVKDRAVQAVRNIASQAVNQVRSTVSNAVSQARSTVSNVANQARSTVSNAVSNLTGGAASTLKSVFGW